MHKKAGVFENRLCFSKFFMTGFKYLLVIIGDNVIYTNNFFAYVNFPQRVN